MTFARRRLEELFTKSADKSVVRSLKIQETGSDEEVDELFRAMMLAEIEQRAGQE